MTDNDQMDMNGNPPNDVPAPDDSLPVVPASWASPDWWTHIGTQIVLALGTFGILSTHDSLLWSGWITKGVAAAFVLLGIVYHATYWIKHQTIRQQGHSLNSWLLAAAFFLGLGAPLGARAPGARHPGAADTNPGRASARPAVCDGAARTDGTHGAADWLPEFRRST